MQEPPQEGEMLQTFAVGAAVLMMASLQDPSTQPAAKADPRADRPVVLTGCVAASTEGKKTRFMLINASPAPAAGEKTVTRAPETGSTGVGTTGTGTSGTGTTASPTAAQDSAQVNVLLTSDQILLQRHVNRRVEVQGRMKGGAEATTADAPRELHVAKVRRLSGACSGGK